MRTKLFAALLAVLTVAAFGIGPAGASAGTVELQYQDPNFGPKVKIGTYVKVASSSLSLKNAFGNGVCEQAEFEGKDLSSSSLGEFSLTKVPKCVLNGPYGLPMTFAYFGLGTINFTYVGTGEVVLKYGLEFGKPGAICHYEANVPVTWTSGGTSFQIEATTPLAGGPSGCPPSNEVSSGWNLSNGGNGAIITIVGIP